MLDENKLLFDKLYEKTKDFGRTQFIRLLMSKERENQQFKNNWNELKEWLNNVRSWNGDTFDYEDLINKMQEIESRKK